MSPGVTALFAYAQALLIVLQHPSVTVQHVSRLQCASKSVQAVVERSNASLALTIGSQQNNTASLASWLSKHAHLVGSINFVLVEQWCRDADADADVLPADPAVQTALQDAACRRPPLQLRSFTASCECPGTLSALPAATLTQLKLRLAHNKAAAVRPASSAWLPAGVAQLTTLQDLALSITPVGFDTSLYDMVNAQGVLDFGDVHERDVQQAAARCLPAALVLTAYLY